MADSDDKIASILIKFGMDPAGAQAARAELVGLKTGTTDAADAAVLLGAKQLDLEHDLAQTEKRFEGVSGQSREMYRIFSELDRIAPGLGEALRASFIGPLAGVAAGLYFVDLYAESLAKAREEAAKLNEELAKEQIAVWDDQLKGMSALADEAERYHETLIKIRSVRDDMNQQERDRNEILQAQWEAQEKILKAQEQADLAAAGDDEVKKAQIRQRYEDTQSRDELAKERQKVATAKNDMDRAAYTNQVDQDALTKAQAGAVSALNPNSPEAQAAARAKQNQDFLNSQNQSKLTDIAHTTGTADPVEAAKIIAQQIADAQNKVKIAENSGDLNAVIGAEHWLAIVEARQKELDAINANNVAIAQDQVTIDAHNNAVKTATQAESAAATAALDAAKKAQETADAYATAVKILKINSDAAQQAQQIQFSSEFQTAITAATSPAGTKLTAAQQAAEQTIIAAFQALHGNFILWIETLVAKVQAGQMTAAQENAIIAATLAQLQGQMQNGSR